MAEWGKSQNVPISVPPTNHWKAQPEARFPEEKKPPWEINAHVKSVSTKLFSVGASVPHKQSCIWGIATPFYGAHVKFFFLSLNSQREKCRFPRNDSKLSLFIQENGAMRTQALSLRRGGKGQINITDDVHLFHKDRQQRFLGRIIWEIKLSTLFLSILQPR